MSELTKYPKCEVCEWGISYGKVVCGDCADNLRSELAAVKEERGRLREALVNIDGILEQECQCIDVPYDGHPDESRRDYDNPSCHSQYCPHYIKAYVKAALAGEPLPD